MDYAWWRCWLSVGLVFAIFLFGCGPEQAIVANEMPEAGMRSDMDASLMTDMDANTDRVRDASVEAMADAGPVVRSVRLPGTLLWDPGGEFWMIMAWPERALVSDAEMQLAHLDQRNAVDMNPDEERCLIPSREPWHTPRGWIFVRGPDNLFWLLNEEWHMRREMRSDIMPSYNLTPAMARPVTYSLELWTASYRYIGAVLPAEGTIVRTSQGLYLVSQQAFRPFSSEDVARELGYPVDRALMLDQNLLPIISSIGQPLTRTSFDQCPALEPDPDWYEDHDHDFTVSRLDCDDHDPNRHPGHIEICDGKDNDCNGIVDDGFLVGLDCLVDDNCASPGITQCDYDRWSVYCQPEEDGECQ